MLVFIFIYFIYFLYFFFYFLSGWIWFDAVALRKTMLRAHRQAVTWQDEWVNLTMEDVREIERQTQAALAKKMGGAVDDVPDAADQQTSTVLHFYFPTYSTLKTNRYMISLINSKLD